MGKMETLSEYVKSHGMLGVAKHIVENPGEVQLTEHQYTQLATEAARKAHPDLSPDRAFSRYFGENEIVRRGHQIVKQLLLIAPFQVGGGAAVGVDDPEDALAQLEALVAEQRARSPEMAKLSPAQAFAKVYTDPANAHLARAERKQNRPRVVVS